MKEPMQKRTKMYHYLPDAAGELVRKKRTDMSEKEISFIAVTKELEGRDAAELQQYKDAAAVLHS